MKPSTEERIIAIISHLAALALGAGLVVPAIFWSESRKKSTWLRYQTLQALGYQSLGYTVWLLAYLLFFVLIFVALVVIAAIVPDAAQNNTISTIFAVILIASFFVMIAIYLLIPVVGAIFCGMGKDFRYPILGARLAHSLGYQPGSDSPDASLNSAFEEHFAASMNHFAVIMPIWGLLAPLYLWISHEKHSPALKFQSIQTTIYQAFVNILYFGLIFGSILIGLGSIPLFAAFMDMGEWTAVAGLMVMALLLNCTGLIIPLFHILGQWAGLQLLRGREFRYPLIGKLSERWL